MADEQKKYIIQIESNLDKYIKESIEAKKRVKELQDAIDILIKSGTATAEQIAQSNASLRNAQTEYKNSNKLVDLATQANRANAGSYEQLYRNWQLAQTELKLMGNTIETDAQGIQHLSAAYIQQSQVVATAKKALNDFGAGVHDNRLNVGSYTEAIEGAIGKFQMMPGPVGAAATAIQSFGKKMQTMLATPLGMVVAAIAAAVAVFAGLIKIFTGTAEGGGKIKELFASIGAIINELRARVVSFIDIFSHILKGEWKEAGQAARETFTGLGESLRNAASAAAELARQQRELTKELAYHISEEAQENDLIQKYLFYSKDRTKSDKERLDYLDQAMTLGKEKAEKEVEYAKRQFDIDVGNAALKAKIDQKTLSDWISMNAMQQQLALESSTELQKAYNLLGPAGLKALEESQAKISQADEAFFAHMKRAESQRSSLVEEIKKNRLDLIRSTAELMTLEAAGDTNMLKAARKKQLDADLQESQITNEKKLLLRKKYEQDILKIDQEALTIFEQDENRKRAILKETFDWQIRAAGTNDKRVQELQTTYAAKIVAIDKGITDKKIVLLETQLSQELKLTNQLNDQKLAAERKYQQDLKGIEKTIAPKEDIEKQKAERKIQFDNELTAINDLNNQKLTLLKKYDNDVNAIEKNKKINKTVAAEQIATLTSQLDFQLEKIKKYQLNIDLIDKQGLATKKDSLKTALDAEIKALEDEKKIKSELLKNPKDQLALEQQYYDKEKQLSVNYVDAISKIDKQYANNKKAELQSLHDAELALTEADNNKLLAAEKAYQDGIKKINESSIAGTAAGDQAKAALKTTLDQQTALYKDNSDKRIQIEQDFAMGILTVDANMVTEAQKTLFQQVEDFKAAEEAKRQLKIATGEWDKERLLIDEENRIKILETNKTWEFDTERERLKQKYDAEIESAKQTGADVTLIKQHYADAQIQIDKLERDAKLNLYAGMVGNLAAIFGKTTAIGKAAAVAETTISTYAAAQKAYETNIKIPPSPLWSIIAAAAAVAAGIANVKAILAVKSGLPGDSGGGSVPSSFTPPTSLTASAQRAFAPTVGSTLLTQPQLTQNQVNALPNQGIITAEQLAAAVAKLPPPIVSIEDINARIAANQKVTVRGNI